MDTIANLLTSLLNAQRVGKVRVAVPHSRSKEQLVKLLVQEGLLGHVRVQAGARPQLIITLAYDKEGTPRIHGVRRLSTPGRRLYAPHRLIPQSLDGVGTVVVSTSRGLMIDRAARRERVGGELVCEIW